MTDDDRPWGYMHEVEGWLPLPKGPGLIHFGPPPFDVTLPDGRVRRVVHKPEGNTNDGQRSAATAADPTRTAESLDDATPPTLDAHDAPDIPDAP